MTPGFNPLTEVLNRAGSAKTAVLPPGVVSVQTPVKPGPGLFPLNCTWVWAHNVSGLPAMETGAPALMTIWIALLVSGHRL